jgi:hydroxymethylbilane synthase
MLHLLHHHQTAITVTAERALLRYLEGGCQIPIGAYGQIIGNELRLDAIIGSLDGKRIIRGNKIGATAHAEQIGIDLAKELFNQGGKEILEKIRQTS